MSYDSDSQVKFGKNVVELLTIRTAPTTYIRTSIHTKPLIIDGETYHPYPFDRGQIKLASAPEDTLVQITVPLDHPIVAHYQTIPTAYDVQIELRQGHLDDNGQPTSNNMTADYPIMTVGWVGDVEVNSEDGVAIITVVTLANTLVTSTLTRYYQLSCPLRLYGTRCKATRRFQPVSSGFSRAGNVLTFPSGFAGAYEPNQYIGGVLSFIMPSGVREHRVIIATTATTITFGGSTAQVDGATSIEIALGCTHTLAGCHLHGNSRRYGGFPFMPLDNPVGKSMESK